MSSVAGMGLSADDRLDILELPGRYAEALDTLQPDQLSAVFTDDAIWEVEGGRIRLEGLAAIEEFMGRPDVHPGAHIMANPFISGVDEVDGASVVRLKTRGIYPVGPSDPRDPSGVFYGRYEDEIVRTDAGWRIRYRCYRYGGA